MERVLTHTITQEEIDALGTAVLKRVLNSVLHLSRHEISQLKFHEGIRLNGQLVHVSASVQAGDLLELRFPQAPVTAPEQAEVPLEFLYEDEDLVVVHKPAGMPVHASHGHLDDSLGTLLQQHYASRGQAFTVRLIGRLDRMASGAVLFAKNQPAAARLWKQRDSGRLQKTYLALVEGVLNQEKGEICLPLLYSSSRHQAFVRADGKEAYTTWKLAAQFADFALVEVQIKTGRTHQIRAHFAAVGHPLLGDACYGGTLNHISRPALHCARLVCLSPFLQKNVDAACPLEEDLAAVLKEAE